MRLTHPTGADITTTVRIVGNLGSDAATTVWGTSSGDTTVETTDQWIGTDDADGIGTPAIVHYIHSALGLQPTAVNVIGDNIEWSYDLTVPAGETVRLAHYTILADSRADAQAAAEALVFDDGFGGEAAVFLTQDELDTLANFVFNQPPVASPQTVAGYEDTDTVIALEATDPDGDPLTATVTTLPTAGQLFQYDNGARGSEIAAIDTLVTDSSLRVIFVPANNAYGAPYGQFEFSVDDGQFVSDEAMVTVNIAAVNDPPTAEAGGPYAALEGTSLQFSAAGSSDLDGDTLNYRWDFDNDGIWDTEWLSDPVVSHFCEDDYSGVVKLQVSDGLLTDVDEAELTVTNVAPVVEAGPDQTTDEGATVTVTGVFTDAGSGDTHTVEWDFGDGATADTLTASHIYADNGVYTAKLTVTDDDGDATTDTLTITVNNVAPVVEAGPDQTTDEGATVTVTGAFTDAGSGDTHTVEWDFGDGTTADTLTASHVYADNGVYTAKLTVTDDDGDATSDTLTITVNNVAPVVEAGPDQTTDEGATVTVTGAFTDAGSGDTHAVEWDFGDGTTAGTLTASHIYADNGVYTAKLTVTDDDGDATSDTLTITVNNVAPVVEAGPDQTADEGASVTVFRRLHRRRFGRRAHRGVGLRRRDNRRHAHGQSHLRR